MNNDTAAAELPKPERSMSLESRVEVSDMESALERIAELEKELESAYDEIHREREESRKVKIRLKSILWDYLPNQRNVTDIPPVDSKAMSLDAESNPIFRDYKISSFIGRGHFGKVYCAMNKKSNERVAVKVLDLKEQLRLEDVLAIEQEIRAIKVLTHPNCVRLVELIHSRDHICIFMNYVSGGNLHNHISCNHPISTKDIQTIFSGIMHAVAYMHQRGFSHRDIKPENVLLGSGLEPVLIDFGLCTKTSPGASIKSICGTNGFMAPELNGTRSFNPQPADMWSCGCTLAECTFGINAISPLEDISPATAATTLRGYFHELRDKESSDRTQAAVDFIEKTLVDDPKKRLSASKALEHPIARRDGGTSLSNSPEGRSMLRRSHSVRSLKSSNSPGSITSPSEFRRLNALRNDPDSPGGNGCSTKLPSTPPSGDSVKQNSGVSRRILMQSPKASSAAEREHFRTVGGDTSTPKIASSQSSGALAELKSYYGALPQISPS